jgi:4-hydroxy-tetrahydrodipicolinate reductase
VPDATLKLLSTCIDSSKPLVIGTTGFSTLQREQIVAAAEQIPVVMAPNMSVGVNVVFDLLATVARVVGVDSDVEIVEAHHRDKIDSPSGSAVRMGEIVAESLGTDLASAAVYARQGSIGAREPGSIGFATVRGGDIVGEHTVLFATEGERIEITHCGSSRMNFVRGSLRAARWLAGACPRVVRHAGCSRAGVRADNCICLNAANELCSRTDKQNNRPVFFDEHLCASVTESDE